MVEVALAAFAHEVRTPLTGILAVSDLLATSDLGERERRWVDTIKVGAEHLAGLATLFVDAARSRRSADTGDIGSGLAIRQDFFDLRALARSAGDSLAGRATAKGLELVTAFDPRLPDRLVGDPTRLRQVLFNLLGNAIKFTDRGRVTLAATGDARAAGIATVTFTVADTGIGMDAAAVSRLFNVFSQADSSMSRRFGGSGLGLAISQKLVEAMDGKIAVESTPGRGSKFSFTLRFAWYAAEEMARDPADNDARYVAPSLRGRLLVVEDDRINQRVIGHFLKQMGLEITLVEDGYAAVHAATTAAWDVVLMDCQLPGLDGLEATRRIREKLGGRALPIVALTANASTADRAACFAAGMDDFLTKPVRRELLAATLEKWLGAVPARPPGN